MQLSKSDNLRNAKNTKNDEFYTRLEDIEKELPNYAKFLSGKSVYCNCDDPVKSNFWKYLHENFTHFKLKSLISTHYEKNKQSYMMQYNGGKDNDDEYGAIKPLNCNGDFRSDECVDILKQSDIVISNCPFSLARNYINLLTKYDKKFIIVGDINWVTYKDVFSLFMNESIHFGINNISSFIQPDRTEKTFGNKCWFTNINLNNSYNELQLTKSYNDNDYVKYHNYNAINVDRVSDIPYDYFEVIGVPITYLQKHDSNLFEIVGLGGGVGFNEINKECARTTIVYENPKQHNPDGTIVNGGKVNTHVVLPCNQIPHCRYYTADNCNCYLISTYARVFIKRK